MKSSRIPRLICGVGAVTSLLCIPPIAGITYALGPLHPDETPAMWFGALGGAFLCWCLASGPALRRPGIVALLIPLILAIWFEIGIRVVLRFASPATRQEIAWLAERTFPEGTAVQGHPFLQFVGRPQSAMRGNEYYGNLSPYNRYGFLGKAGEIPKPKGIVRVACLGGSTTARGYPAVMERLLNESVKGQDVRFEALNFGLGFWTTAHTLANYVLNVVDFEPDYVVVLHGWNDERALGATSDAFRSDYSHVFKTFEPPPAPDRWLIRSSVAYRWIANKLSKQPEWASMMPATTRPYPHAATMDMANYRPFVRNLRTIAQTALVRGSVPVLVTMPHCTDEKMPFVTNSADHMQTFANLTRRLWETELKSYTLLVDLDQQMTGKHDEWFIDAGHMTPEGIEAKARAVAEVVLADWNQKRAAAAGKAKGDQPPSSGPGAPQKR